MQKATFNGRTKPSYYIIRYHIIKFIDNIDIKHMDYRCRFVPNITTGDLHIGHCMTYVANLMQACKSSATVPDLRDHMHLIFTSEALKVDFEVQYENFSQISFAFYPCQEDHALIAPPSSLVPTIISLNDKSVYKELSVIARHYGTFFDALVSVPCIDLSLKTNCFIRGRDLEVALHMKTANFFFDHFTNWDYEEYWVPLLVDKNGTKISKSRGDGHACSIAELRREHNICPSAFLLYPIYKFEGNSIPDIKTYHQTFDIEKIAQQDNWVFDLNELLKIDRHCIDRGWDRPLGDDRDRDPEPNLHTFQIELCGIENDRAKLTT